jgi:hypothetical protein
MKVAVSLFELPRLLGMPQYVEYEPPPREWCTSDYCPHEGLLTAEGCRRGVCVRYRVWVYSRDGRRWEAKEKWRRRRDEESGGCLRQQVADALWELAERFSVEVDSECDVVLNGVRVGIITCRSAAECVERMLQEYEHARSAPPKPRRSPEEEEYEELLQRHPLLRWWDRQMVIDVLRHGVSARWGLRNLLGYLEKAGEEVWAFLARFDLDLRCSIDVFKSSEEVCVKFHIRGCTPRIYCLRRGQGWRPAEDFPKYAGLRPTEDGRLVEVYRIGDKEYIRVT